MSGYKISKEQTLI